MKCCGESASHLALTITGRMTPQKGVFGGHFFRPFLLFDFCHAKLYMSTNRLPANDSAFKFGIFIENFAKI